MAGMITKELQETFNCAVQDAIERRHEYLTLEHLLFALLKEKTGSDVIVNCGGDIQKIKRELENFLDEKMEKIPASQTQMPEQTAACERVITRALMQAECARRPPLTVATCWLRCFKSVAPTQFTCSRSKV